MCKRSREAQVERCQSPIARDQFSTHFIATSQFCGTSYRFNFFLLGTHARVFAKEIRHDTLRTNDTAARSTIRSSSIRHERGTHGFTHDVAAVRRIHREPLTLGDRLNAGRHIRGDAHHRAGAEDVGDTHRDDQLRRRLRVRRLVIGFHVRDIVRDDIEEFHKRDVYDTRYRARESGDRLHDDAVRSGGLPLGVR